jgi:glycosyltransferase involved in cell wall biosynthesis
MAMRKPVIATDCGGNRELVSSPEVGWLIPAREVAPLARAIAEVIDDEPRCTRVAENAREHVVRGFSKELRIARLENLYSVVLAKGHGSRGGAETRRR